MAAPDTRAPDKYTGLRQLEPSLPSHYYYDLGHHERELRALWYQNWVYLCRSSTLREPRAFRTFSVGSQSIVVFRDQMGALHAFHNTCRHRGSVLCVETEGRLNANMVTCPYHNWSYNLQGALVSAPGSKISADFDHNKFHLYEVALAEWGGFVFVNLSSAPTSLDAAFRSNNRQIDNWPLDTLVVGHTMQKTLACNWKIFWENFSECYHCPGVHPELSGLVPIYGRRFMGQYDDPEWETHRDDPDPTYRGGLRPGALTWSMDGQPQGATFPGLTSEERSVGHRYVTALPSVFIVAHIDYVRAVSLRPRGPEETEVTVEWLFSPETLYDPNFDIEKAVALGRLVIEQDGRACELNQRGIHSIAHRAGVLMPQEYAVHAFQDWVRRGLLAC